MLNPPTVNSSAAGAGTARALMFGPTRRRRLGQNLVGAEREVERPRDIAEGDVGSHGQDRRSASPSVSMTMRSGFSSKRGMQQSTAPVVGSGGTGSEAGMPGSRIGRATPLRPSRFHRTHWSSQYRRTGRYVRISTMSPSSTTWSRPDPLAVEARGPAPHPSAAERGRRS